MLKLVLRFVKIINPVLKQIGIKTMLILDCVECSQWAQLLVSNLEISLCIGPIGRGDTMILIKKNLA